MKKCPKCSAALSENEVACRACGADISQEFAETLPHKNLELETENFTEQGMSKERWQKIKALFDAAQEIEPKKRGKFLENSCDGDAELRNEVEKLLSSFDNAESFLETPAAAEVASMFKEKQTYVGQHTTAEIENVNFVAGTILASRYRIIGLIGKGGMGEVYKAEDMKLSQNVALKFLPDSFEKDKAALARFHSEVRTARQVAHPNVCRVFDIGEIDGRHFLSMEFIDGDDLSSLLRRIGRLPSERAIEISRQLCVGLSAIHNAGILHRDFKPANVIIDSKGKARITDFGIAGLEEEIAKDDVRAGTPAYMSPEQIKGKDVTAKSDIYSLGLVLYEIYTGKQAFSADSVHELIRKQQTETPTNPSEHIKGIDPLVEQVIFQCLEKNPKDRPQSALQVAMALPGGNPLQVALEAGDTPSPEMVAAAPTKGALRPVVAVSLLAAVFVLTGLLMVMSKRTSLYHYVPLEKSPEVLRERSRELAEKFGYPTVDSYYGYILETNYLRHIKDNDKSLTRWQKLSSGRPAVYKFWYRQSQLPIAPIGSSVVTVKDPPNEMSGMLQMYVDTKGRLLFFDGVPSRLNDTVNTQTSFDWSVVFTEAGLNISDFQTAESLWTPQRPYDERKAWTGKYAEQPDISVRIEAAAYRGKLVYFQIVEPWTKPEGQTPYQGGIGSGFSGTILVGIFFIVLAVSTLIAIRNVRLGRSDLKGAFRVTIFLFIIRMIHWGFSTHHIAGFDEAWFLISGLQSSFFWSCFAGLMYLAFEPYLRKHTPERVIAWNRLLAGNWRDPLVGRDILIGAVAGSIMMFLMSVGYFIVFWIGEQSVVPHAISNPHGYALLGIRGFPVLFLSQSSSSIVQAFMVSFILLFFTLLLRSKWLGLGATWLMHFALFVGDDIAYGMPLISILLSTLFTVVLVFIVARFGVLAIMSSLLFYHLFIFYPITTNLSAWYAGDFILCVFILLALAVFAFYQSLAGQPIFQNRFLQEDRF